MFLMGGSVRLGVNKNQPQLLAETAGGKILRGRPFCAVRDSFVDGLKLVVMGEDPR